jgi:hypothetical protein
MRVQHLTSCVVSCCIFTLGGVTEGARPSSKLGEDTKISRNIDVVSLEN